MTDDADPSPEFSGHLSDIERKWQAEWDDAGLFEPDPTDDEKFYITVAYPYPSGGMHIGHVRTYMLPDVFARYQRMRGKNVLFPMAWHVTGTPIIGALNRVKEGDEDQISTLRETYNVPMDVLESFEEPMDYARYFIDNSYRPSFERLGFSVDWRREFTTNDDQYNRFIEWQYERLRDQGKVNKGLHPTKYCLKDENPVTTHDLLEGEDAERLEYTVVKFDADGTTFPTATLRPETVYGVTHLLVNPAVTYDVVEVDGERWYLAPEATTKFDHQDKATEVVDSVAGRDLVGETATNPVTGDDLPILPATFIDPDAGTGLVMSVPGHAPYDWISLQDLKDDPDSLADYGLDPAVVEGIDPVRIIDSDEYDDLPAKAACERHGVESQADEAALEAATDEVYTTEFNDGVLGEACGAFAGRRVEDAKQDLIDAFRDEGAFDRLYDFTEPVVSRSGGKVVVSLQESWFIDYEDEDWKDLVRRNVDEMDVIPGEKRPEFHDTVDWLEQWPCIRNYGLGTRLPFDSDFIVEPLSDSTIYMAFYTIRHIVADVDAAKLDPTFFDHVFGGEGDAATVAAETGVDVETVEAARESFTYWYPLDWRTSAYELIRNHLTFMLFHHTALFDEENWVEGVATWGMGLLEGQKMSSSKGHVIVAEEAIDRHSADIIRMHLFASNEPWQDFDWRPDEVAERVTQLRRFRDRVLDYHGTGVERDHGLADRYVRSRLQSVVAETTEALDDFQTRKAVLAAFFELNNLFNTYLDDVAEPSADVLSDLLETQVRLMVPFVPHLCEELWAETGHEGYVSVAEWPEADESLVDEAAERRFAFVEDAVDDVRAVADLVEEFDTVTLVLAADWKRDLFADLAEVVEDRLDFGEAMGRLTTGREEHGEAIQSYLREYMDSPQTLPDEVLPRADERAALEARRAFVEGAFDASLRVVDESETDHERADRAEPGQPAIILE
jgi:leucyl-tRNA synthetase